MEKISCNIIKDILPLYIDEVVSDETKRLVEEHTRNCHDCRKELDRLSGQMAIPINKNNNADEAEFLGKAKKELKKKQTRTVVSTAILSVVIVVGIAFLLGAYVTWSAGRPDPDLAYVQEYVPGTGNIKGSVDVEYFEALGEEFAIGANADGYAVFKDPRAAMNTICRDYKKGIQALKDAGAPANFRLNYEVYMHYGMDVQTSDTEAKRQANIVASFVDIYENSFEKID